MTRRSPSQLSLAVKSWQLMPRSTMLCVILWQPMCGLVPDVMVVALPTGLQVAGKRCRSPWH